MITGRRASDWLRASPQDESQGEDERSGDRRAQARRAPRRQIAPLFAATLLRHLAPAATDYADVYGVPALKTRCGVVIDRWA